MNKQRILFALFLIYFVFAILLNSVGTVILQVINNYGVSKSGASVLEGFKDLPIAVVSFLVAWQWVTQPIRLYLVGTLLCLWVWLAKGLRTRAWWAFGTMMVAWFIGLSAKYVFQRARPVVEDPVSQAPGYSFPSGHALNSAAWATTVVILLWPLLKPLWARVTAVVLARVWVGLAGGPVEVLRVEGARGAVDPFADLSVEAPGPAAARFTR